MKTLILTLVLLSAQITFAAEVMDSAKFTRNVAGHIRDAGGGPVFNGALSELGWDCEVGLEKDARNRMTIVMRASELKVDVVIRPDDSFKLVKEISDDGSYSYAYSFGVGGVNKVTFIHGDDAYDAIILKTGNTSLECSLED